MNLATLVFIILITNLITVNSKPQIGKKRAFNEEAADSCPNTSSPKRTKSDLERFIEGELRYSQINFEMGHKT